MNKETIEELLNLATALSQSYPEVEKLVGELEPYGELFMKVACGALTQLATHRAKLIDQLITDYPLTREQAVLLVLDSEVALKRLTKSSKPRS